MATLQFNKLQPVGFGDKEVTPEITTEKKLRLQNTKGDTEENLKAMIELIASCFGDDSEFVKDFISKHMSLLDIYKLQAYLIGGEKMVEAVEQNMQTALAKEQKDETA